MIKSEDLTEYENIINDLIEADFLIDFFNIPSKLEESVNLLKDEIVERLENQKGYIISNGMREIFYRLFIKEIIKKAIKLNMSFEQMADLINDTYNRRVIARLLNKIIETIPDVQEKIIDDFLRKSNFSSPFPSKNHI